MICPNCGRAVDSTICNCEYPYPKYNYLTERIYILETAMQKLVNSIEKTISSGYTNPSQLPEFIIAYNEIKQLLK